VGRGGEGKGRFVRQSSGEFFHHPGYCVEDRVEVMVKWPLSQLQYFPDIEKIPLLPEIAHIFVKYLVRRVHLCKVRI
jgi:hypothetical protein